MGKSIGYKVHPWDSLGIIKHDYSWVESNPRIDPSLHTRRMFLATPPYLSIRDAVEDSRKRKAN